MARLKKSSGGASLDAKLGAAIKRLRVARGLTLSKLAAGAEVSIQQIHKYETGESGVPLARLFSIARTLGVRAEALLAGIEAEV